jgi:tetratricopeptide (TPR) repeat protein
MFAIYSLGSVLVQSGRTAEAFEHLDAALARARVLGARRFELNIVGEKAESLLRKGERADALRLAEEAVSISREVGMGYAGPYALAVLAWATDEPSARAAALSEGEMVLQRESVGHNLVWYYRVAAEVYMEDRNWQAAESCAQRLRLATSAEPVTMVEFLTARIGALCSVGRGERGPDLERKLDRLVSGGELRGYHDWVTDLRKARIRLSLRPG